MESSGRRDADRCCHRVNLEDAVLSDTSQTQKDKHWAIPLPEVPGGVRSIETGSRWWGRGEESVFHRHRASLWEAEKVLETMVGTVAQQCEGAERSQAMRVNTL